MKEQMYNNKIAFRYRDNKNNLCHFENQYYSEISDSEFLI